MMAVRRILSFIVAIALACVPLADVRAQENDFPSPTFETEVLKYNPTWNSCPSGKIPVGGGVLPMTCVDPSSIAAAGTGVVNTWSALQIYTGGVTITGVSSANGATFNNFPVVHPSSQNYNAIGQYVSNQWLRADQNAQWTADFWNFTSPDPSARTYIVLGNSFTVGDTVSIGLNFNGAAYTISSCGATYVSSPWCTKLPGNSTAEDQSFANMVTSLQASIEYQSALWVPASVLMPGVNGYTPGGGSGGLITSINTSGCPAQNICIDWNTVSQPLTISYTQGSNTESVSTTNLVCGTTGLGVCSPAWDNNPTETWSRLVPGVNPAAGSQIYAGYYESTNNLGVPVYYGQINVTALSTNSGAIEGRVQMLTPNSSGVLAQGLSIAHGVYTTGHGRPDPGFFNMGADWFVAGVLGTYDGEFIGNSVNGGQFNFTTTDNGGVQTTTGLASAQAVTITIATPGVLTVTGTAPANNTRVTLSTSGALPTGLSPATNYYVVSSSGSNFELAATVGGAAINTTGSQSGTQTATISPSASAMTVDENQRVGIGAAPNTAYLMTVVDTAGQGHLLLREAGSTGISLSQKVGGNVSFTLLDNNTFTEQTDGGLGAVFTLGALGGTTSLSQELLINTGAAGAALSLQNPTTTATLTPSGAAGLTLGGPFVATALTVSGLVTNGVVTTTSGVLGSVAQASVPIGGTGDATFTAGNPLLGNGTSAIAQGTILGTTTKFATVNTSATYTSGHCVQFDSNLNLTDAGGACTTGGAGGVVSSGSANDLTYYAVGGTTVTGLASANNAMLVTSPSGVPSISTTLPNALAMGTPASLTLTNATGLPIATGVSGLGTGVAAALGNALNGASGLVGYGGSMGNVAGHASLDCALTGCTMSGSLAMGGNAITGAGTITGSGLIDADGSGSQAVGAYTTSAASEGQVQFFNLSSGQLGGSFYSGSTGVPVAGLAAYLAGVYSSNILTFTASNFTISQPLTIAALTTAGLVTTTSSGVTGSEATITAAQCPTATTGAQGCMQVGTGLSVSTGIVTPTFGTATNQVAEGGVITAGGPTGSASVIPIITYNAAGQLIAVTSAAVTAPAGTLTGATLAAGVTASSLTSTGTLTSGKISAGFDVGGVTMQLGSDAVGDIYYAGASEVLTRLADVAVGSVLVSGGVATGPAWASNFTAGTITASLTGHASLDCPTAGCTMSGNLAMGTHAITGAGNITGSGLVDADGTGSQVAGAYTTSAASEGQVQFFNLASGQLGGAWYSGNSGGPAGLAAYLGGVYSSNILTFTAGNLTITQPLVLSLLTTPGFVTTTSSGVIGSIGSPGSSISLDLGTPVSATPPITTAAYYHITSTDGAALTTFAEGTFTAGDANKLMVCTGIGSLEQDAYHGSISGFTSATQVSLSPAPSLTMTSTLQRCEYGPDQSTNLQNTFTAGTTSGLGSYVPGGIYLVNYSSAGSFSIATRGSGYTASATGTLTWAGGGCTTNPVINVDTDASGGIADFLGVATGPVCSVPPSNAATTWTPSGALGTPSVGATFYTTALKCLPPTNYNALQASPPLCNFAPGATIIYAGVNEVFNFITFGSINEDYHGFIQNGYVSGGTFDGNFNVLNVEYFPFFLSLNRTGQDTKNRVAHDVQYGDTVAWPGLVNGVASGGANDNFNNGSRDIYLINVASVGTGANPTVTTSADHGFATGRIVSFDSIGGSSAQLNVKYFQITVTGARTFTLNNTTLSGTIFTGSLLVSETMPSMAMEAAVSGAGPTPGFTTTLTTITVPSGTVPSGGLSVFIADLGMNNAAGTGACVDGIFTATYVSPTTFTIPLNSSMCGSWSGGGWVIPSPNWTGATNSNPIVESFIYNASASDEQVYGDSFYGVRAGIVNNPATSGWDGKIQDHGYNSFENGELLTNVYAGGNNTFNGLQTDCPVRFAIWIFEPTSTNTMLGSNLNCGSFLFFTNETSFVRLDGVATPGAAPNSSINVIGGAVKAGGGDILQMVSSANAPLSQYGQINGYAQNNVTMLNVTYQQPDSTNAGNFRVVNNIGSAANYVVSTYTGGLAQIGAYDTNSGHYGIYMSSNTGGPVIDITDNTGFETSNPISFVGSNNGTTINGPLKVTLSSAATTSAVCYNTSTGLLSYDGTIGTCSLSSEQFKHDIEPIKFDALAGVMAMKPVTFEYNDGQNTPGEQLGFIAEKLEGIDPLLVGYDNEHKPNSIRFLGPMFAYVVGSEQQMQAEIESLRARVSEVEAANDNLRQEVMKSDGKIKNYEDRRLIAFLAVKLKRMEARVSEVESANDNLQREVRKANGR